VLSGLVLALLVLGALLPRRSLGRLILRRPRISPVHAGDILSIEVELENQTSTPVNLFQIFDTLPHILSKVQPSRSIETIPARSKFCWQYDVSAHRRGIYHWQEIRLRTASPLGLFWSAQRHELSARAVVYPQVLELTQCPLLDDLGLDQNRQLFNQRYYQAAAEGVTKNLRSYRYGDPIRFIHWRSSARFEEFKVRELEVITGGKEIIIGLDTNSKWQPEQFEQAVTVAASLYCYAYSRQLNVKLWLPGLGLISGQQAVLEVLAAVEVLENKNDSPPPGNVIWLTQNPASLEGVGRWIFFSSAGANLSHIESKGLIINSSQSLVDQLQSGRV
jgi:uncharacterized protein (DUF58 family)